ncbi:MAG: alkaline phosphatase family protein [Verrucomicrobia bacterium]|nr:alkaline phosphatase family protein [Verrucomicrobiota bacterium]
MNRNSCSVSRSAFLTLCLAAFVLAILSGAAQAAPAKPAKPTPDRLVVLISVDGLASYYLDDPKADMPTIRRLAREGASAKRMKCILPSVTWPTHTTLATGVFPGRHGVIGNSYWDREEGKSVPFIPDPLFDKDEIVKAPTIYDVVNRAGLKTAAVCWPASRNAKTLNWTVPDIFPNDLFQKYATPEFLDDCRAANIPFEKQEEWCKMTGGGVPRDWMYARMTSLIIRKHKPNLLMLHLVEPDHVQHAHGPKSSEAYWVCSHADDRVRDVVETCEAVCPGRATIFVTSDHGFIPVTRNIQPNVLLRQEGLIKVEAGKVVSRQVTALSQGGSTFIYVLDKENRAEIMAKLPALFRQLEGVELVIEPKVFAKHGLINSDKDPRMGDMVLTAKSGFAFSDNATSDKVVTDPSKATTGTHGHNPAQPMMGATFVAWGAGIKRGAKLSEINSVDVAPTIARLLGVQMKDVDGKVLTQILIVK